MNFSDALIAIKAGKKFQEKGGTEKGCLFFLFQAQNLK
jgi:hypothetical protein